MTKPNTVAEFEQSFIPEPNSGCWLWLKTSPNKRYGALNWHGRRRLAHVVAYELYVGPMPDGLVIDHRCRNTFCVNPDHLEPKTQLENTRLSAPATKTHCSHGHPYADGVEIYLRTDGNGKQYRRCLTCYRLRYPATRK
jgi:hypothetical protein